MVTSAFTERKANIKSFAFPFFVCVSLFFFIVILCTNHRREVPFTGNSPMSLLLFSLRKEGGREREKKNTKLVVEEVFARIAGARK
jgi:hypothetical protein